MRSRKVRTLAVVGLLTVMASTIAGCGRRGRLEPPPDPNAAPRDAAASRTGLRKKPPNPPIAAPDEPFILDPLL